jgi:hypothetical protein
MFPLKEASARTSWLDSSKHAAPPDWVAVFLRSWPPVMLTRLDPCTKQAPPESPAVLLSTVALTSVRVESVEM